ncbi:MAG: hypothetical protein D3916_14630 [Candidatus Electrothrix sp. MAN1_4]|nr:hypothetical protein [Candidatus Electrothrix sp. MAN1_4]
MGVNIFGEFALIRAAAFVLSPIVLFGSLPVLIREMSLDKEQAGSFLVTGLALNTMMSIVVFLLVSVILFFFPLVENIPPIAVYLAVLSQIFFVSTRTVGTVFVALEKIVYEAGVSIVSRLLTVLFFLLVVYFDIGPLGLFIALPLANCLGLGLALLLLAKRFEIKNFKLRLERLFYVFKQSYPVFVSLLLAQGYTHVNIFILKGYWSSLQVSMYQAPQRLTTPLLLLPRSIILSVYPMLARLASRDNPKEVIQEICQIFLRYCLALTVPICIIGSFLATPLVILIFGEDYAEAALSLQILIWLIIPSFTNTLLNILLTSLKRQKVLMISNGICFISNVVLSFVLIPKFGHQGASWAFLLSFVALLGTNGFFMRDYLPLRENAAAMFKTVIATGAVFAASGLLEDLVVPFLLLILDLLLFVGLLFVLRVISIAEMKIIFSHVPAMLGRRGSGQPPRPGKPGAGP